VFILFFLHHIVKPLKTIFTKIAIYAKTMNVWKNNKIYKKKLKTSAEIENVWGKAIYMKNNKCLEKY
jgi:hypothetical protein